MLRRKSISGVIDPVSLIGVLFLIVTLVIGTKVTNDRSMSLNISEKASDCFNECRQDSGRERCNERCGVNVNWKGENVIDTSKVDKDADPKAPTCDANGVQYSVGAVTYVSADKNATCGEDGKWNIGAGTITEIQQENVPQFAKETYDKAVEAEKLAAEKLATEQQTTITTSIADQENLALEKSQCLQDGGSWFENICSYAQQKEAIAKLTPIIQEQQEQKTQAAIQTQPTVTTVTTPVSPFAGVTIGVTGKTIPQVQQTYIPPKTYTPPLLTVPAFTAEDLLRKLPGLENLNINDFKELNYPTINRPDPAIITNKYGIVGAYANDPVRCKYGNGAIKEGDGKYACPTDTFANPILDNSQNISWYDQPLDIPALEFNLESTKPTVESEIKKITDPLFNYILNYFNWGIIDKITTSSQNVTEGTGSETALPELPPNIGDIPSGFSNYTDSSGNHVETLRGGKELFIDISGSVYLITDKNMDEQFYTVPGKVDYIETSVTDSKGKLIEQEVFWIAPTDVAQNTGNPTIVMDNRNYSTNTRRSTYYEANLEGNITDSWTVVYRSGCVLPNCVNKVATWWENQKIKVTFLWDDILGQPHSMPSP